jgi:hypothetical protein
MTDDDAMSYLIQWLRQGRRPESTQYGYDVYIPNVIRDFLVERGRSADEISSSSELSSLSPYFLAAAWEIARRGIIRPGVRSIGEQAPSDGAVGAGFSITPFGHTWLSESDGDGYVPTEPGRFSRMIQPYSSRFGAEFQQRAQEAARCYGAHAHVACCAMCSAASESILISTAIARHGEEAVLAVYRSGRGRARVENMVIRQAPDDLAREFRGFRTLLKHWRDSATHGAPAHIGDNEAYMSLAYMLRFAQFVDTNWTELTTGEATKVAARDR